MAAIAGRGEVMRLVGNDEVEAHRFDRRQHVRTLHQIDRCDHDRVSRPRVDPLRPVADANCNGGVVQHRGDDAESIPQLGCPRLAQSGGAEDQRAVDQTARAQLAEGSARPGWSCPGRRRAQQHARCAAQDGQRGLQSIGEQLQVGVGRRPHAKDRALAGNRTQRRPQDGVPLSRQRRGIR